MSGKGSNAVVRQHLFAVAVIRGDYGPAAIPEDGLNYFGGTFVNGMDSFHRRLHYAGMAYHVRVGKVQYHDVVLAAVYTLYRLLGYLIGAHLGLEIVGGYLWGRYKAPVLPGIWGLHAAVEEKGHVCVFLGLGYPKLGLAAGRKVLPKGVVQVFWPEGYIHLIREGLVVLGHADVMYREEALPALESVKVFHYKGAGYLPRPVGAEIVEDYAVVSLYGSHGPAVLGYDGRNYELVGNARIVARLHGMYGVGIVVTLAVYHGGICLFYPLKAVVPVHGVIASHYGGYFTHTYLGYLLLVFLNEPLAAFGRNVTAVHEAVYIYLTEAMTFCKLQQSEEVLLMAVHAAGTYEAVYVQCGIVLSAILNGAQKGGIFKEIPVLYGFGYSGQLLIYYASRAYVHMAYLGVAHLAVRQAYVLAGSLYEGMGVLLEESGNIIYTVGLYGVALSFLAMAKSVQYHKCGHLFHIRQISCLIIVALMP